MNFKNDEQLYLGPKVKPKIGITHAVGMYSVML